MHIVGLVIIFALCKNSWLYDQSYRRSSRGKLLLKTLREIYCDLIVTKLRQVLYSYNMFFERLGLQLYPATQIMSIFTFMKTLMSIGHYFCVNTPYFIDNFDFQLFLQFCVYTLLSLCDLVIPVCMQIVQKTSCPVDLNKSAVEVEHMTFRELKYIFTLTLSQPSYTRSGDVPSSTCCILLQ